MTKEMMEQIKAAGVQAALTTELSNQLRSLRNKTVVQLNSQRKDQTITTFCTQAAQILRDLEDVENTLREQEKLCNF